MIGFTTLVSHSRRWQRQRDTLFTIQQVSDRDLWDIGAKRADMPSLAMDFVRKTRR
jgi:uncharacterized protein YjiS (DUF1127 family)